MKSSTSNQHADAIIVGSGINSLVCAALLARAGRRVLVFEREATLGGCIRTEELTLPGFLHDTLSTAHPQFTSGPAYAALKSELHSAGLEYCNTESPTGVLLPDGRHLVLSTSKERNFAAFESAAAGDGTAFSQAMGEIGAHAPLLFSLLGNELWRFATAWTVAKETLKLGPQRATSLAAMALTPARHWLEETFRSDLPGALLAPWVLHCGIGPDAPASGLMAQIVPFMLQDNGMPIVKGGNANTVKAFLDVVQSFGGQFIVNAHVSNILVENGRAEGVRLHDGTEYRAKEVICNVTPTQLYGSLVEPRWVPPEVVSSARAWRYGKGNMQIHLALSEAPQWPHADLAKVCYLHLSSGPSAISRAVNEAERGLLPAEPTICVAQPTALDASRAPKGKHILWIQLPECPRFPTADAAGEISVDSKFTWTKALREAYANRIIKRIARHVPNLERSILGRAVLSPKDLEAMNMNLVGGDPYGGDCSLDQYLLWRPSRHTRNHATPIKGLWHIGASTHPGPGLGGTSGLHVARELGAMSPNYSGVVAFP